MSRKNLNKIKYLGMKLKKKKQTQMHFYVHKIKNPLWLNNNNKKIIMKLQPRPWS